MSYTDLATLKQYGQVTVSADDNLLSLCIAMAQASIEGYCGASFEQGTVTELVAGHVDADGVLTCLVHSRVPVTAVSAVQVRIEGGAWQSVDLSDMVLPTPQTPPTGQDARIIIYSARLPGPRTAGPRFQVRATYTGGYAVVPDSLRMIATRLAWWYYELRKAPLGMSQTPELGRLELPVAIPPDIKYALRPWRIWRP